MQALLWKPAEQSRTDSAPWVSLAPGTGLALLPLTDEIMAKVMGTGAEDASVPGFYELRPEVAEWARLRSRHGVVAYLHTEFFGGAGFHAEMAWHAGAVTWGPRFTATSDGEAEDHYVTVSDRRDMAINELLRWWGVRRGDAIDEFAAAGLTRCRWSEQWAPEGGC